MYYGFYLNISMENHCKLNFGVIYTQDIVNSYIIFGFKSIFFPGNILGAYHGKPPKRS